MLPEKETVETVRRVTYAGMAVNVVIALLKGVAGVACSSQALLADAVHSLSDLVTDFAVVLGVRYWAAPADERHPYGHGKIEAVVAVAIGIALAAVAFGIGRNAALRLLDVAGGGDSPAPGALAFLIAVVSIAAKEAVYRRTLAVARRIHSTALKANAWHHRSDAISSVPVALALAVSYFAPSLGWVDSVGALVVAVFILDAAWGIVRPAVEELTDAEMPGKSAAVERIALGVKGVESCHHVRTRRYGAAFEADLHIHVDAALSVAEGHAIGHAVSDALLASDLGVIDAVVHVEPASAGDCRSHD